jgi:predicted nucleic acid-binding protein
MKGIVVDASVAAAWLLDDEKSRTAEWVLDQMQAGVTVSVPTLWLLEITNVLFNAERRKRIDRQHRDSALERIERLPLTILAAPSLADLKTLRIYAEKHQLTAYDAEYLRVSKEQKLILATLDGNLLVAAKREKVQVAAASRSA